ncbi:hypothetical protein KX729_29500 [Rhizobium sp. XQZ8]|uniref:hypothetical protein n=1 Tax=Rhizobium populisoli TaxID=2859785 RepID=UPI001CA59585|nr:hypothetical protein [Rhizobium populisoli]MBW6425549.1 hypothetical protein [Rhizobium populisoli]
MDDAFSSAPETAVCSGWEPEEIAAALVELADNFILAVLANRAVEDDLAVLKSGRS